MGYTQILADYLVNLRYEDIPNEVVERAKLLTMHVVGAAIAGRKTKMGADAVALARDQMGTERGDAVILGSSEKCSMLGAAFANGTLADVLDWEDCSWTGHPSAGAVPAALAVAEGLKKNGKEYLTALVGGYEVYQRIAMAVQPKISDQEKGCGWGLTSWQIFAAAMPSAKMYGFDRQKMNQAIGMAATLSPVAISGTHDTRSDAYHYHHGFTARDGITACMAVEKGVATLNDMLETGSGYVGSVRGDEDRTEWYTKDLGEKYLIMETLFKHWPANMWIQTPLDQLDELVRKHHFGVDDIADILVAPNIYTRMTYHPQGFDSLVDAQFSIPYCLGLYFTGAPSYHWADEALLKDPTLLAFGSKVHADESSERLMFPFPYFQRGSFPEYTMTITLKDGRVLTDTRRFPLGHPRKPFDLDQETKLFRQMTDGLLRTDIQDKAIAFFTDLEHATDFSVLSELVLS